MAAGGWHNLALTADGRVIAWGGNQFGQATVPSSLNGVRVVKIAAGSYHSLAVTESGHLVTWGYSHKGQANVPYSLAGGGVESVAGGIFHSIALSSNGSVTTWGDNDFNQVIVPAAVATQTFQAIAAGGWHNIGLTTGGQVVAWNWNFEGQCNVPASVTGGNVTAVGAGVWHSVALVGVPATPVEKVAAIASVIAALPETKGGPNKIAFTTKLEKAAIHISLQNEASAIQELRAFIQLVSAQAGKKFLSQDQALSLIGSANDVIASIESN
ncbi:MAG: RCC1 domain-containing protein [Verrucomicrobiales bacterium]